MDLKEIIQSIPLGKKRDLVGSDVVDGIVRYENSIDRPSNPEEITEEILLANINQYVLKAKFKQALILFNDISNNQLNTILNPHKPQQPTQTSQSPSTTIEPLRPLHPFQERIRRLALYKLQFSRSLLLHMPTGSGKTRTASELICDLIRIQSQDSLLKPSISVLWLAQSQELCDQAFNSLSNTCSKRLTTPFSIHRLYRGNKPEINPSHTNVIVASTQSLSSSTNTKVVRFLEEFCDLMIIDEAHRATAPTWVRPVAQIIDKAAPYLIGLTATPGYSSDDLLINHAISHLFQNEKVSLVNDKYQAITDPIKYLTNLEYLAQIEAVQIQNNPSQSLSVELSEDSFKFDKRTIKELALDPHRNDIILDIIEETVEQGQQILVFTCSVAHNYILQYLCKRRGIHTACIDQQSNSREEHIEQFSSGQLQVLINYGVLTTGFDAPSTNACIIARPVGSVVEYSQMVGRILRGPKNTGNKSNKLFTIHDNLNHGEYDTMFKTFDQYYHHA